MKLQEPGLKISLLTICLRKPEPYKGKGVMYSTERVIRKAGKAAVGKGA